MHQKWRNMPIKNDDEKTASMLCYTNTNHDLNFKAMKYSKMC